MESSTIGLVILAVMSLILIYTSVAKSQKIDSSSTTIYEIRSTPQGKQEPSNRQAMLARMQKHLPSDQYKNLTILLHDLSQDRKNALERIMMTLDNLLKTETKEEQEIALNRKIEAEIKNLHENEKNRTHALVTMFAGGIAVGAIITIIIVIIMLGYLAA